jgi:outer membrane protein assembly factor BamD
MIRRLLPLAFALLLTACAADGEGRLDFAADAQRNYEKGLTELQEERWLDAIRFFEHVRSKFPYSTYAAAAELKTADAHFSREKYTEAIDGYRNFVKFHPTHANVDWASFRVGESHVEAMPSDFFLLPSDTEKDQTQVRAARTALEEFLRKYPKSEHRPRAEELLSVVVRKLASHELVVAEFYARRERWEAAAGRWEYVRRTYPDQGLDGEVSLGLVKAYRGMGDPARAKGVADELAKKHPNDPNLPAVQAALVAE